MGATESASQSQSYTNEKSSISNQSSNNNNSSYSSPKTQNSGLNSPKFNSRTAVAIAGAIILERGKFDRDDTYRYCHKCESCGHATTNIIQSDKFGLTETINRGKFYCIKCGNLQNVEIQA